jgi:crotonobetainyl-CoA:carnitine CoA-transferase CaiB-like acyl-CoA transferase
VFPSHDLDPAARLTQAARALSQLFRDRGRKAIRIEQIDGHPARDSEFAEAFVQAGFRADYKGLVLERFAQPDP